NTSRAISTRLAASSSWRTKMPVTLPPGRERFDTVSREQRDAAAEAARKLGLVPRMIEVKGQQGYGVAFGAMDDTRGQPIILSAGPMFFRDRAAIAQALLERRIPSIAAFRENTEAG